MKTTASVPVYLVALAAVALAASCERVSHDNIDRWMNTQKGPDKLDKALRDGELDPELRAHAGQISVRMNNTAIVAEAFAPMPDADRQAVLAKLVPRLWADARVEGELTMPAAPQIEAKDALFELRHFASGTTLAEIDEHLVDWLTGGYYPVRSRTGRARGEFIIRTIGAGAAPKMLQNAKSLIASPPDAEGRVPQIEDALLLGLAATGSPDAIELLVDLMSLDRKDRTLPQRVIDALFQAYVANKGLFPVADGKALVSVLPRLVSMARDETRAPSMTNDIIQIIGATGPPECIGPLVELIAFPHENAKFLWVAANAALQCGKARAIVPVADALPESGSYKSTELAGALWEPMAVLDNKRVVAEQARTLLESKSWVARIIGIEALGHLSLADSAAADAQRIGQLAGDKTVLRGWWGKQDDVPKGKRKPEPSLGQRAAEVAGKLATLAPGGGK